VPVDVLNLPEEYVLGEVTPEAVEVTLRGPARSFYLFNRRNLAVTVDASLAKAGRRTFQISEQNIRHPPELPIEAIHPAAIRVAVRQAPRDAVPPTPQGGEG
jgi:YbbR domain-containing protein